MTDKGNDFSKHGKHTAAGNGKGMTSPRWLDWAREIQALSQTGYHYAQDDYQRLRYKRLIEIAAEIVDEHTDLDAAHVLEAFCTPIGYATPRVDVRGAVFCDQSLLLVRERIDGGWTMPGGWADVGEIPSTAAEREVLEEAGFQVKATKVVGVYDSNRLEPLELFHAYKIVFMCDLIGGSASSSIETSEVRFFGKNELPELLSSVRTNPRLIQDAFRCLDDPTCPTVFD
jgi:ADP-ribose pyrophosphatase YjhB (NUDIX family)